MLALKNMFKPKNGDFKIHYQIISSQESSSPLLLFFVSLTIQQGYWVGGVGVNQYI